VVHASSLPVLRDGPGIYLGTISRSMAQFALLIILVTIVLSCSGGARRSKPAAMAPVPHLLPSGAAFVSFSQVIYRGRLSAVCRSRM